MRRLWGVSPWLPCSACCAGRGSTIVWSSWSFFRLDLGGEWSSLIETSKVLAGLILDAEADGTTTEPDATQEGLKSFRKSFLALAAHVLEEAD
jgi:hypothetical protein